MEKKDLIAAMMNSISEVLEKMFFMPIDFLEAEGFDALGPSKDDEILASKLNFKGAFSGYCVFHIPKSVAASLSADFMGFEASTLSRDQISGTVKEITNMVVGNMFSLLDETMVFDLEVPELVPSGDYHEGFSASERELFVGIQTLEDFLAFQMIIDVSGQN